MFGGGTQYVETLDQILEFVESHQPTTDELVGWNRGTFANVSSRDSIMRRVSYLEKVGFLRREGDRWVLGENGREYFQNQTTVTLLRIMCNRNVGLRSLLYSLSAGPMTIDEISDQQLDTHPELGWSRGQTDMAKQRTNWLRSMGLIRNRGDHFELTDRGHQFVTNAIEDWANAEWTPNEPTENMTATTYATVTNARALDPEFRETVLARYDRTCSVSGVDHPGLLDVAHILSWSEYPDHRADLANVLPFSKTHHAAFDRELFTIDREFRLRVNPSFETRSNLLQRTIIDRGGDRIQLAAGSVEPDYLQQYNATLSWV